MNRHHPEWIAGLVDGELRGVRRWLARRHAARCPLCAAEYRHQRHVRSLLAGNPPAMEMSDTPEFFWSKVRGEIERRSEQHVEVTAHRLSLRDRLRQHEVALAAVAALLMFTLGIVWLTHVRHGLRVARNQQPAVLAKVEKVATPIPDTVATVLQTEEEDVAVVWISGLPWTENMTEMKTLFAHLDT